MNNHIRFVLLLIACVLVAYGFLTWQKRAPSPASAQLLIPLSLALDWTPNTNHTGIYVALANKWYEEEGIDLTILPFSEAVLPDVVVASGKADIGIGSTEGVVADAAAGAPVVSIAAIMPHGTSALAVLKSSGITRPAELTDKIYGGFGAPFEEPVINTIIRNDGGDGTFKNVTLRIEALNALKSRRIDFAWIFLGWEGVQAQREGIDLTTFPITAYGIPDYSSPDIITSPETLAKKTDALRRFMRATARGYEYAREHPREAAQFLINAAPPGTFPDSALVLQSQAYLSPRYAEAGKKWGMQSKQAWHDYPKFMLDNKAVIDVNGKPVTSLNFDALYTNELLQ